MTHNTGGAIFTTRPTVSLELPLSSQTRILHPEQVILKIADRSVDIGALCFSLRSEKIRGPSQPREVMMDSLLKRRPKQILQLIKALSGLNSDGGKALTTVGAHAGHLINFTDWADRNGLAECLAGGQATRDAFHAWAAHMQERYRRQDIGAGFLSCSLASVCQLLQTTTGLHELMQGIRTAKRAPSANGGTEPLPLQDFTHAVAINQCLFDGLCDLVLEQRPFPYRLELPGSLGWAENHIWLFPTNLWRVPPHIRDGAIHKRQRTCSAYDYANGRLATPEEIEHRYQGTSRSERLSTARQTIKKAKAQLDKANADPQNIWRLTLAMHAMRAFMFLFFCNSGGNEQVVRDLETDGTIDASVSNQKFRALKWRAAGKEVTLEVPAAFMPRLRRFMELRRYLLQDRTTPFLFFGCGKHNNKPPARVGRNPLDILYRNLLLDLDPQLPRMGPRALRASVDDYFLRLYGSVVAAAFMGHTVETEDRKYGNGSAHDHHEELSAFMESVSESARRQRIIQPKDAMSGDAPLEEGGRCVDFGHPSALNDCVPIRPDCQDPQGCLFCTHRLLIADEEDARKLASAAYVMEQLVLGPQHEKALRPLICKCDRDLEMIAAFPNCSAMVKAVRRDVFDKENLTPYWADRYLLFLELGIIS